MGEQVRIDKWLWAARIYKTRSIAAEACKKGRISINGTTIKPSTTLRQGDVVQVRKSPITYHFKVLKAIQNRVGAKLVPEIMENITPPDQLEILELSRINGFTDRARGTGRPTKKERRSLDGITLDGTTIEDDLDDESMELLDFDEI